MHVVITADPYVPVPPVLYGGIERVIDLLVRGLVRRGHQVTLFAHPDSRTPATLHAYGAPPHRSAAARLRELWQVGSGLLALRRSADIVHSFGRLAALLPVLPLRDLPKVQSYQRAVPWHGVHRASQLAGPSLAFTGCSTSLYADGVDARTRPRWHTIFNAVDTSHYVPTAYVGDDAPLMFLGRLERIKGPHRAIAIARRSGRRLVLAGNVATEGAEAEYFAREVKPHIDGRTIEYVGPVDDRAKNDLLGRAAALLMPIEWDEPFGIVMAEALACGTPVIGVPRGSVPEIVRDGVNGFLCATDEDAAAAVPRLSSIARRAVRADCEARFGHEVIVGQYEALYRSMVK